MPTSPTSRSASSFLAAPAVAALALFAIYVLLSFGSDVRGTLGTDSGGKLATLVSMQQHGTLRPDVGYWAEPWDASGQSHGLIYTSHVGGQWVNVTTLPMVVTAYPLWVVAGGRGALVLPMLGSVLTALAARSLDRRLRAGDGMFAFWLVGLASPALVYGLDFWEHSLGLACIAWACVALFDVVAAPGGHAVFLGLGAGTLFGLGFSMRTEALVYAAVAGAVFLLRGLAMRRLGRVAWAAIGMVVGLVAAVGANRVLEQWLIGAAFRSTRAAGTAAGAGADPALRAREALITTVDLFPGLDPTSAGLSIGLAASFAMAAWAGSRKERTVLVVVPCVIIAGVLAVRFSMGPGFVPGLVPAWPFAAAAVVLGWTKGDRRMVLLAGLVPLPVVFLFQFPGGAIPQWAGRYILASGFLLTAVGLAERDRLARTTRTVLVASCAAVSLFGLSWVWVRSHAFADLADRLEGRPEEVLVADNGFLPREFGATYGRKRWLAASTAAGRPSTHQVAIASGAETIGVVYEGETPPALDGFSLVGTAVEPVLPGVEVRVASYRRAGS